MIEVNGVIYRNLEEQVQKNKDDINTINQNVSQNTNSIDEINRKLNDLDLTYAKDEDIQNLQSQISTKANQSSLDTTNQNVSQNTSRISSIETTLTEITPNVMRALKTPISAPSSTELVGVDGSNAQTMIGIGDGLSIENGTLKATGGGSDVIVDSALSTTSTNPVQNKVVTEAIKQNETDISSLETLVGTNISDIGGLKTTTQNQEGRISALENAGGGVTEEQLAEKVSKAGDTMTGNLLVKSEQKAIDTVNEWTLSWEAGELQSYEPKPYTFDGLNILQPFTVTGTYANADGISRTVNITITENDVNNGGVGLGGMGAEVVLRLDATQPNTISPMVLFASAHADLIITQEAQPIETDISAGTIGASRVYATETPTNDNELVSMKWVKDYVASMLSSS